MRIKGEWWTCDDDGIRPIVRAYARSASGWLQRDRFLVDTGADRTVFSSDLLGRLGTTGAHPAPGFNLSGIGGGTAFVIVETPLEFRRDDNTPVLIRGAFAAFTDPRASDLSILGRDVLDNFDLIISRRRDEVLLLAPNHRYEVART